ncbi:sensory box/GGDEF domain protein [Legionella geestiana]|uniref:Sensory box/GGDEF domain protein n=2 Tax=Legionella geestiana TaxID=45065 RepID=A0A0W0TRR1_9GAMM|nr:EAL domain-containing protein [Legionella geestiana]KTC98324.1 sensory box/GGDEF domain protein [Legionella geestiana]STX53975.1 sensory box/GGDEF domain protein [Legionella geestiana]
MVWYNLAVIVLYATSGFLGLMLSVPPGYATAIWAPSGIALSALLVWGLRALPGVFLGSLILNTCVSFQLSGQLIDGTNIAAGLITGTGASLQAAFGYWLVKRFVGFDNPLHLPRDILVFAMLTGPVSSVVATTFSNTGLYLIGKISAENLPTNLFTWWTGDSIGILLFTPIFLIAFAEPAKIWRSRILPVLCPLCLTFLIVIVAHIFYRNAEFERVQTKFEATARHQFDRLQELQDLSTVKTLNPDIMKALFDNFSHFSSLSIFAGKTPLFVWNSPESAAEKKLFTLTLQHITSGKTITFHVRSSPNYMGSEYSWYVWSSLAATLFFCALMSITLQILYGQRYLLQYLADAKTLQLRTEKAKNMLLLNAAGEGILWIDTDYRITFVNPSAERMLQYSCEALRDEPLAVILHQNAAAPSAPEAPFYRAIHEKTLIREREAMFLKNDNETLWVEYTCIPIVIEKTVRGAAIIFSDISERVETENQLQQLAHNDALTGLPNRTSFFRQMELAIARAQRNKTRFGVCFMDADNFKLINDTWGHAYGDKLLTELPHILSPHLRDVDFLARIGGDEFGLIFEDVNTHEDIVIIIHRILETFKKPLKIRDEQVKTSLSIGVAMYPEDGINPETLVRHADLAMYQAKKTGKSTYSFYTPGIHSNGNENQSISAEMSRAIDDEDFTLYYQPIIHAKTGEITGIEALLRWHGDTLSLLPLRKSIRFAEDRGYIHTLGNRILEKALQEYQDIIQINPNIPLSVNLSVKQVTAPGFAERIEQLLTKYSISPGQLAFELTETAFIENLESVLEVMRGLKSLGIAFSLDDFGVGASSIHLLKKLPLSSVKIDSSFVGAIEISEDDATLVLSAIQLSHALGFKTVAEGVEKDAQAVMLREWGCNSIQGHFYAEPMPLQELLKWIRNHSQKSESP